MYAAMMRAWETDYNSVALLQPFIDDDDPVDNDVLEGLGWTCFDMATVVYDFLHNNNIGTARLVAGSTLGQAGDLNHVAVMVRIEDAKEVGGVRHYVIDPSTSLRQVVPAEVDHEHEGFRKTIRVASVEEAGILIEKTSVNHTSQIWISRMPGLPTHLRTSLLTKHNILNTATVFCIMHVGQQPWLAWVTMAGDSQAKRKTPGGSYRRKSTEGIVPDELRDRETCLAIMERLAHYRA